MGLIGYLGWATQYWTHPEQYIKSRYMWVGSGYKRPMGSGRIYCAGKVYVWPEPTYIGTSASFMYFVHYPSSTPLCVLSRFLRTTHTTVVHLPLKYIKFILQTLQLILYFASAPLYQIYSGTINKTRFQINEYIYWTETIRLTRTSMYTYTCIKRCSGLFRHTLFPKWYMPLVAKDFNYLNFSNNFNMGLRTTVRFIIYTSVKMYYFIMIYTK